MSLQTDSLIQDRTLRCIPWLILFLLILACVPVFGGDQTAPPGQRKVILMNMSVSRTPVISGTWRTWQNNKHYPDVLGADGKRDISSVFYPSIGVYDAGDPDYIDYACQLISMMGIDAISFYTPSATDEWHLQALRRWVAIMKKFGLEGMPRPQPKTPVTDLNGLLEVFQPVAFKHRGHPLIPFFCSEQGSLDALAQWKTGFSEPDRPCLVNWLHGGCNPPFDGGFDWAGDATHPARTSTARDQWKRYFDARLAREGYESDLKRARKLMEQGSLRVYLESVNPGFDDSAVNGWGKGSRYIERDHGNTYRYRWNRAIENGFALACIPTWDDWGEGSVIEPTVEFGNLYLEITREYVAKFKGSRPKTGNFDVPQWIYLVRKATRDSSELSAARQACELLEKGNALGAEKLILPLAEKYSATGRIVR